MRILLDHNLPRRLRDHLPGHDVKTARDMRWDELRNGVLLNVAAKEGFDVFLTIDKKMEHEQNLATLPLAIIALNTRSNALPDVLPVVPFLQKMLADPVDCSFYVIESNGSIIRLLQPRR